MRLLFKKRTVLKKRMVMGTFKRKSFPEGRAGLEKLVPLFYLSSAHLVSLGHRRFDFTNPSGESDQGCGTVKKRRKELKKKDA
jgi:hypothetical protein